jgi:hypothetical protein
VGYGGSLGWDLKARGVAAAGLIALVLSVVAAVALQSASRSTPDPGTASLSDSYGKLPLAFAAGIGRADFSTSTAAGSIALTRDGAVIAPNAKGADAVQMHLEGAQPSAPAGTEKLPGVVNDLRGQDQSRWRTNVPTFARVSYPSVYPGIGLDYYGRDGRLEYDFRVAAGADPSRIAIDFGKTPVRVAGDGDLLIGEGKPTIRQHAPVAYQWGAGGKTPVGSRFEISHGTVGFQLGAYDPSRPLVIDPLVIAYSTYLGGNDDEDLNGLAVDGSGNTYLAGATLSANYPTTAGAPQASRSSSTDAFVTKMNSTGTALVYSTYLGGDGISLATDVAIDSTGTAYLTGWTRATNFPGITAGSYRHVLSGTQGWEDAFVTKLNAAGSSISWSTYVGGSNTDHPDAIAIDGSGNAYITGETHSFTDATGSPPQTPYPVTSAFAGGTESNNGYGDDAFVTKVKSDGTTLLWSDYLNSTGINDSSQGTGIAVDSTNHVYLTGNISGVNFPKVNQYEGASTPASTGSIDGFLTKIAANGLSLDYSTYFGGTDNDFPADLAIDSGGRAFIVGGTISGDSFDLKNQFQNHQGLVYPDAFLTELDPSQSGANSLIYSTLLDGNQDASAAAVAVDSSGEAYVGGSTGSGSSFPKVNPISSTATGSAFLAKFDTSQSGANSVVYSTTIPTNPSGIGGAGVTGVGLVGTDAYLAGTTNNNYYPTTSGAYLQASASNASYQKDDGFISKLTFSSGPDNTPPDTTITSGPLNGSTITTASTSFGFESNEIGSTFQCSVDNPVPTTPCTTPYTTPELSNGQHTFYVRATDGSNNTDTSPDSRIFTVNVGPPPDTTPPQTTITGAPAQTIKSKHFPVDVKFAFKSSEAGATFTCKLDNGTYKACASPKKYSLGKGEHTFAVKSKDDSGNEDSTADTAKVEIKKKRKKHKPHHRA